MSAQEFPLTTERRRAPRYPVALEIGVNEGTGVTMNLSSSGVFFETACAMRADQEVALVFPFEHAAPSGTRAACAARVLRVHGGPQKYQVAATYETVAFEMPSTPVGSPGAEPRPGVLSGTTPGHRG